MYVSNLGLTNEQAEAKAAEQYGWPIDHPKYESPEPIGYIITS